MAESKKAGVGAMAVGMGGSESMDGLDGARSARTRTGAGGSGGVGAAAGAAPGHKGGRDRWDDADADAGRDVSAEADDLIRRRSSSVAGST